jgi:hypothetical protein
LKLKKHIKKALEWVLSKFDPKKEAPKVDPKEAAVWPFPVETSKRKPRVAKATTRPKAKPVVKKTATKKTTKKAK